MMNLNPVSVPGAYRPSAGGALRGDGQAARQAAGRGHDCDGAHRTDPGMEARRRGAVRAPVYERAQSVDMSRAQNLQLEVMTAEGDRVTLTLSGARTLQLAAYRAEDSSFTATSVGAGLSASNGFTYTVEGDLSAEESAAIEGLVDRVSELAGRFFDGDIAGTLERAGDLGLDMKTVASFSLQMDMTRAVQVTSAYRSVQAMAQEGPESSGDLSAFINDLASARTASSDLFDELLRAAVEWMQDGEVPASSAGDSSTGTSSAVSLLDSLLSALDTPRSEAVS